MNSYEKNILIVGAGFSGAVIARELAEAGYNITIIDKRDHVAGNAYDYVNEHGIRIHKYGPHLFHTKMKDIWIYLSKFTKWVDYQHKVKALLKDGRYVTLPVNAETSKIVGKENVIDTFIRPYTKKMWGMEIEQLDPSVISRVPIREDMNELYFPSDTYQGMPADGYTRLFENMLNHPSISLKLNCDFRKAMLSYYSHVFSAMPIDEYYDFKFGELPYRSIKFHTTNVPLEKLLPVTTVNFTHNGPYTRVTEWKNIPNHGANPYVTTLTYEEPCDYHENDMQRYYPVKDLDGVNRKKYLQYLNHNRENDPTVQFIGRCGLYMYCDMDQAISMSLNITKKFLEK